MLFVYICDLFCLVNKMSDLPENLHIKRETTSPSTPEDKSPHNIKAKLNLHVKRRIQEYNQTGEENTKAQVAIADTKHEPQKHETTRQKRPYHKRADKNKSTTQSFVNSLATAVSETITTPQRKYKHKIKQIVDDNQDTLASNTTEENLPAHNSTITAGVISAGDEDDGHENDMKAGREKEKCPDVLAMVLSMKKRALMQEPEVQCFLKEIMEIIKS